VPRVSIELPDLPSIADQTRLIGNRILPALAEAGATA